MKPSEMTTVELMDWVGRHGAGPSEGAALVERSERLRMALEFWENDEGPSDTSPYEALDAINAPSASAGQEAPSAAREGMEPALPLQTPTAPPLTCEHFADCIKTDGDKPCRDCAEYAIDAVGASPPPAPGMKPGQRCTGRRDSDHQHNFSVILDAQWKQGGGWLEYPRCPYVHPTNPQANPQRGGA